MCEKCLENKATETHDNYGVLQNLVNLCKDCAIQSGFRTINWYEDNEDMVLKKYGLDWRTI